jgi:hypothetical protein
MSRQTLQPADPRRARGLRLLRIGGAGMFVVLALGGLVVWSMLRAGERDNPLRREAEAQTERVLGEAGVAEARVAATTRDGRLSVVVRFEAGAQLDTVAGTVWTRSRFAPGELLLEPSGEGAAGVTRRYDAAELTRRFGPQPGDAGSIGADSLGGGSAGLAILLVVLPLTGLVSLVFAILLIVGVVLWAKGRPPSLPG